MYITLENLSGQGTLKTHFFVKKDKVVSLCGKIFIHLEDETLAENLDNQVEEHNLSNCCKTCLKLNTNENNQIKS